MKEVINITLDLETLGRGDNAPIVQIGVLSFDDSGSAIDVFERKVDLQSLDSEGVELSTVAWWLQQNSDVQDNVFGGGFRVPIKDVLEQLEVFILEQVPDLRSEVRIWQHSSFDAPKVQHAFKKYLGREPEFKYWWWKDIRTLTTVTGVDKPIGTGLMLHDAVEDCRLQAEYISTCLNKLK